MILRRQIERLADDGLALMVGAEAEYFLVRRSSDGSLEVADSRTAPPCPVTTRGP